jgi:hypothetical protein
VDFILILGVLLILGLLAVGLLSFWPDVTLGIRDQASGSFWRTQARPIAITEAHYRMSNGELYLSLRVESDEAFNLSGLWADNKHLAVYSYDPVGGDVLKCSLSSCQSLPCTCDLPLGPRNSVLMRTEAFGNGLGCRSSGMSVSLPVALSYFRASEPSRSLMENSTIPLVADCQP